MDERDHPAGTLNAASLFAAYAITVARWARRLGGTLVDAEDVVQEVFIVVHRSGGRVPPNVSVRNWLYGITANVVRQQRRKARRRRWFGGGEEGDAEGPFPSQPSPSDALECRQRMLAVHRVLDAMRDGSRKILILHEIEGLAGREIAERMGMKPGVVWVRIHRARKEFCRLARTLTAEEVACRGEGAPGP